MSSHKEILRSAGQVLQQEAEALNILSACLTESFVQAVQLLAACQGKIVVTGVGKSAIIAQKLAATFSSTGSPAVFLHAADAIHGDLGIIAKDDVIICLTKSGNTAEIKALYNVLPMAGVHSIAITAHENSYVSAKAAVVILMPHLPEACPLNLAPTTSTTMQLAIGDALAVCLMQHKNFNSAAFARLHPGGALGSQLLSTIGQFVKQPMAGTVQYNDSLAAIISAITKNRQGAVVVMQNNTLAGIITDGDIRRMLQSQKNLQTITAAEIMNSSPKAIDSHQPAVNALELLTVNNIQQVIVTKNHSFYGIVHLHDLLDAGLTLKNI